MRSYRHSLPYLCQEIRPCWGDPRMGSGGEDGPHHQVVGPTLSGLPGPLHAVDRAADEKIWAAKLPRRHLWQPVLREVHPIGPHCQGYVQPVID